MADELVRKCGTMEVHRRLLSTNRRYQAARAEIESLAFQYERRRRVSERSGLVTIPVVVHVVFNTREQNLPSRQIQSQIDVLNADYQMRGAGIAKLVPAFQPLAADARIQFELATVDPSGNPTKGFTRTASRVKEFSTDEAMKFSSRGGHDAWPAGRYLNIWVCPLANGILGYAQLPGGPAATDGVVINYVAFGTHGTATPPFDKGRTATHEVGHWLNLLHIWGDDGTGCSGTDFVDDTPNQAGPNYGVPTYPHVTCENGPHGDLFMNFMDYTDDVAMCMLTAGQVRRIEATIDGPRAELFGAAPVEPVEPVEGRSALLTFYDRAAGEAQVYRMNQQGALAVGSAHRGWRTTWDVVVDVPRGGSDGAVLCYERASGEAALSRIDGQGGLSEIGQSTGWRTSWHSIVGVPLGEDGALVFYDRAAGKAEVYRLGTEGGLVPGPADTGWRTSWDVLVGVAAGPGEGGVLACDRAAGEAAFYRMDGQGNLAAGAQYTGWRRSWDLIVGVPLGEDGGGVLFYDRAAGEAAFYRVDSTGNLAAGAQYTGWRRSWDLIVGVPLGEDGGGVLFYDRAAGEAALYSIDLDGNLAEVAAYNGWRRSWDVIAATAGGTPPSPGSSTE